MQTIKFQPTPNTKSLKDLLTHAISESIVMDNIKESDIHSQREFLEEDDSQSNLVSIEIPNIYPSDSREHIEMNSANFSRIVNDFIYFLIGDTHADLPLLLISEDEQETLLINLSDLYIHIYYHNNGQY